VDPKIVAAMVAAVGSLLVAIVTAIFSWRAQRRLKTADHEHADALAKLNAQLEQQANEDKARRDYEYEARKRLYESCAPLQFQLAERCEELLHRIYSLARTARRGELEPGTGWLSHAYVSQKPYYLRSTFHRFFAPIALFHLLQEQLTAVDMTLDPDIERQYNLAKYLVWSWTDHFEIARAQPALDYDPHASNISAATRKKQAAGYRMQGVPAGILEGLGQALIVQKPDTAPRIMRFGEFDDAWSDPTSAVHKAFEPMAEWAYDFHPATHPVLWRILVTQLLICGTFASGGIRRGHNHDATPPFPAWREITSEIRDGLDWRRPSSKASDEDIGTAIAAAQSYLRLHLDQFFPEPKAARANAALSL
jgi:hypothetical protein